MNIFDKLNTFPEISDVKFIPVSKLKSKPGSLIHLGLINSCPGKKTVTKEEYAVFDDLFQHIGNQDFDKLNFLSLNELKTRQDEFCHACSFEALYFETLEGYGYLEDFFQALESLKKLLENEPVNTFTFYNELLTTNSAFINRVSFIIDADKKPLLELITPLQKKLDNKLKEISRILNEDSFVLQLKKDSILKAASSFFDASLIEPALEDFFRMQKIMFEEKLLVSKSLVIFNNDFSLDFLELHLKRPLRMGLITENDAKFLIQIALMHSLNETDFVVMPYVLFLARNEIIAQMTSTAKMSKAYFVIVEGKVSENVLETCRSLYDVKNPTFDTYEKVYNIAVNV